MHNCPNCGIALKRFEAYSYGNITINESNQILLDGKAVALSMNAKLLAESLIRAEGRILTRVAIGNVLDFDGDLVGPGNNINTHIVRLRRAFERIDPTFDQIIVERGKGYRWEKKAAREQVARRPLQVVSEERELLAA